MELNKPDIDGISKLVEDLVEVIRDIDYYVKNTTGKDIDVIADASRHIQESIGEGDVSDLLVKILGELTSNENTKKPVDISGYVKSISGNAGHLKRLYQIYQDLAKVREILENGGGTGGRGSGPDREEERKERRRRERARKREEERRKEERRQKKLKDSEFDLVSRWRINDVDGEVRGTDRKFNTALFLLDIGVGFIKGIWSLTKDFGKNWMKFNDDAFKTMRQLGMTRQDIQSIQKSNIRDTMRMGISYGLSVEDINKFQASLNRATGRNQILSSDSMESMAAGRVILGEETQNELITSFDKLGGSVDVAMGHAALSFERAKAMGLNAVQLSSNVAKNMQMASRYAFKNGVDGMAKMTALSQRLKFNLQGISGALDKASSIEGAIDMSAQMQLLGGKYAAAFGNPVELLNAGLNDAEEMVKKMVEITKGNAVFDRESGTVKINNIDRQMMKHAAQATGIDYNELLNATNSQATLEAARQDIAKANLGLTDDQREKLATMAQYDMEKRAFTVTYASDEEGSVNGKITKLLSDVRAEDIDRIQQDVLPESLDANVRDIHALLKQHFRSYAKQTTSFQEQVHGLKSQVSATKANVVNRPMNWLHNGMASWLGGWLTEHPIVTMLGSMALGGIGGFGVKSGVGYIRKWASRSRVYGSGGTVRPSGGSSPIRPTRAGGGPVPNPGGGGGASPLANMTLGRNNTSIVRNARGNTYFKVRNGKGYDVFDVYGRKLHGAPKSSAIRGAKVVKGKEYNTVLKEFGKTVGAKTSKSASIQLGGKAASKLGLKSLGKMGGKFVPGLGIAMGGASIVGGSIDVHRRRGDGDTAGAWIDGIGKIGGGVLQSAGSALSMTGILAPLGIALTALGTGMEIAADAWNAKRDEKRSNKIHAEAQTRSMEANRLQAVHELKGLENDVPEVNGDVAVNGKIVVEFPNKQEFETKLLNDPQFQRRLVAVIEDRQYRTVNMGTTRDRSAASAVMQG